jgi:hypothetical protein
MKSLPALFLAGLVVVFCVTAIKAHKKHSNEPEVLLYANSQDQSEFITMFAEVPQCHGVRLHTNMTDNFAVPPIRLHYYGTSKQGNPVAGIDQYVVGNVVFPNGPTMPDVYGKTPEEVARQACEIIKGTGGQVIQ